MNKPCVWCGASLDEADRVCGKCLSAQPSVPQEAMAPPPPAPGYAYPPGGYAPPPGYGPPGPPSRSNTGRIVAIAIGASVVGLVALAIVCILAITFLGQKSSSKFVAVGPTVAGSSGAGNDYPPQVRTNFMTNCSINAPMSMCTCALEKIEELYTFSEFTQAEREIGQTGQLPAPMANVMRSCSEGG